MRIARTAALAPGLAALVAAIVVVGCCALLLAACGDSPGAKLTGTWQRADDHDFTLTIAAPNQLNGQYGLHFFNGTNGQAQDIGGIYRGEDEIQAALELPRQETGALAAGPADVVPITLRLEGDTLVVYSDTVGTETELWRYERQ